MKKYFIFFTFLLVLNGVNAQSVKILFDATKAETAGNADWVIDEDANNLGWNPGASVGGGSEGNAQRIPTPAQSGIVSTTAESYWKGGISAWGVDCVKRGYFVESLPYNGRITYGDSSNAQDLSRYNVFVLVEPNILFASAEKTAIINFVAAGGSLFIVADHAGSDRNNDNYDSPQVLNDLLRNNGIKTNPFGFLFDSVSISPNTTNIPNWPTDSLLNGPMGAVTQALWASGNTMTLSPTINPSVKGVVYTPGSAFGNTNAMVAYARYGKGKVVGFGDSSPCDDGSGDAGDALYNGWITDANGNHERLIMNATIWLATPDPVVIPVVRDLRMDALIAPSALVQGNNTVTVRIQNKGSVIADTAIFVYTINGLNSTVETVTNMRLAKDSFFTLSFTQPATITKAGNYQLCAYFIDANDINLNNDTICSSFVVKPATGLNNSSNDAHLTLMPNPSNGDVAWIKSDKSENLQVRMTDIQGKLVYEGVQENTNLFTIPVAGLENGLYMVWVQTTTASLKWKWVKL